jgi:hypothetical protein
MRLWSYAWRYMNVRKFVYETFYVVPYIAMISERTGTAIFNSPFLRFTPSNDEGFFMRFLILPTLPLPFDFMLKSIFGIVERLFDPIATIINDRMRT